MMLRHSFFIDFNRSIRFRDGTRYHIDNWPYFITWPLVYGLKKTSVTPNQICFLSFLSGMAFLAGLVLDRSLSNNGLLSLVLGLRILLDCIDGQLARYSGQTSNLGALYDLVADFIFTVFLFFTIIYLLTTQSGMTLLLAIIIGLITFSAFIVTVTVHSYLVLLGEASELSKLEIKARFTGDLTNDHPQNPTYTRKLNFFNKLFSLTWRPVSLMVTSVLGKNIPQKNMGVLLHALSLTEYGMHLVVLWVIILTQSPILYFLIFEIVLFGFMTILLSQSLGKSDGFVG